ncbi:MAG TPA: hypothetical protein VEU11_13675 [Terriglobales bacterium]|jgi:hypothetical protein|nr:hypothetical protein [Terriglobales bacterium]
MEALERMVSESFTRNGVAPEFDYRRVEWSRWFRCADSFSLVLMSSKPGIFALGEELVATGGKRILGLFQVSETDDLGMALGRMFLPGSPQRERLSAGRCFARYAVIEDAAQRHAACAALQHWMSATASGNPESELGTEN